MSQTVRAFSEFICVCHYLRFNFLEWEADIPRNGLIGQWGHYKTFEPLNCVININKFCTLYFYFYLIETIIDIWSKSSYAMFSSVLALHIFRWQWSLNIGSHFQSKNLYCRFMPLKTVLRSCIPEKIRNMIFQKWGGGVKGRLELFRKFIRFGDAICPLERPNPKNGDHFFTPTSPPKWWNKHFCCTFPLLGGF